MKKIFLPLLLLVPFGFSVIFLFKDTNISNNESSLIQKYNPKNINEINPFNTKNANGAIEYRKMIYQDLVTGEINYQQLAKAKSKVRNSMMTKTSNYSFIEEGPDNVGGRTRAIAVDPNQPMTMFAGSVTGGLFVSYNKGNNWERIKEFDNELLNTDNNNGSISISSIAVTKNGILYVATGGEMFEGTVVGESSGITRGDGLWFSNSLTNFNFQQVSYTNNKDILKVVADPMDNNSVYFVGEQGIGLGKDSLGTNVSLSVADPDNFYSLNDQDIVDFKISNNGQLMILGAKYSGVDTWISQDGGTSWTNLSKSPMDQLGNPNTYRAEYSISDSLNSSDNYTIYSAFSSGGGILYKVFRSDDNGNSWCEIGAYAPDFRPLSSGGNPQGKYNLCILSSPDGESCTLGGIDLYKWQHTPGTICYNGQWNQETFWFLDTDSPGYTHADNHFLDYNPEGDMIVGNDGGIAIRYTNPAGSPALYQLPINKGYNVTQFYSMGMGGDGSVIAGAQDNGTQYKDATIYNSNTLEQYEFSEVSGGDGFECEISYLNNNVLISTLYYNNIKRSSDRGQNFQTVNSGSENTDPFYSAIALMETANDLNTKDSIIFFPSVPMATGDTVTYFSENMSIPMEHVLTAPLNIYYDTIFDVDNSDSIIGYDSTSQIYTDTITLPDYIQSLFVCQRGAGVYVTRDMLRFSSDLEWWKLYDISSNMHSFEISTDMNYAWCGSGDKLTRISGLSNAYTKEAADTRNKPGSSTSTVNNDTLLLISNLPSSSSELITISPKPVSTDTLLLVSNIPDTIESLVKISPRPISVDTCLLVSNIPGSSDNLVTINNIASIDSLILYNNIPQLSDSLIRIDSILQSTSELIFIPNIPTSIDSIKLSSTGDTITGSPGIDTINFFADYSLYQYLDGTDLSDSLIVTGTTLTDSIIAMDYYLYSYLDGSNLADTVLGSNFDTLNSDNYIYAHISNNSIIDVLVTGTDIDTINFHDNYNLYWNIDNSLIDSVFVNQISGSDFYTIDLGADFYAYSNGDSIDVVRTGTDISQIDFGLDYLLYYDVNGLPFHNIINGSDFYSIDLANDFYAYANGDPIDVVRTGTDIDQINFGTEYLDYYYINGDIMNIDTITGSEFNTINLDVDFYSYLDGSVVDAVRTGSFLSNINYETDYMLYLNVDFTPNLYCLHKKVISEDFGTICDISVDPKNPDNVMVTSGGTSGSHVYYSTNGMSADPTFTAKDGDLPDMPVFGCVIERGTDNTAIIGTEYGIFSTKDITASSPTWVPNNDELGPVPVFDVTQQWRDWEDGLGSGIRRVGNPGAIYACTFGRGIWSVGDPNVVSTNPIHSQFSNDLISQIKLFPNPSNDNTNITFNLNNSSDVSIQIFDLQGKLAKKIYNNTKLYVGEHNVTFNVSDLQLGTYIVLINTNSENKLVKFIKY